MNKKIFKKSKALLLIMIAVFSAAALMTSCMETTMPANENDYNLSVRAYRIDPAQPDIRVPLRGALIRVADPANPNTPLQGITNDQGNATFNVNIPLIGQNFDIAATYNSMTQFKSQVLVCNDTSVIFLFDTTTVRNVDCGNLNGSDTLVFIDESGSTRLRRNSPTGIGRYERCFTMSNSPDNPETVTATIPAAAAPFSLVSIFIDDQSLPLNTTSVQISPGSTMTLCFSVSTAATGLFSQVLNIPLSCAASSGSWSLTLLAEVTEPECTCADLPAAFNISLPDNIQVGQSVDHSETVFTNELNCPVTVQSAVMDLGAADWQIIGPALPQTIQPGASFNMVFRFAPKSAGPSAGRVLLVVVPEGSGETCDLTIDLTGNGCANSCPFITEDRFNFIRFNSPTIIDTLSNRADNRVFVNVSETSIPNENSVVAGTYWVFNPDTACSSIQVTLTVEPADNYAARYFSISPGIMTLSPGEYGAIDVIFTAPTFDELQQIVAARGNTGNVADSAFTVRIRASSPGCNQLLNITSVVTVFPEISPIINLRAYNQRTPQKLVAENEVYFFGDGSRSILKGPGGTPGPYPPNLGDIYIDVNDNDPSARPPQDPILRLIDNSIEVKLWRSGYSEDSFANVPLLYQEFAGDANYNTGYGPGPITGMNIGDVYAFKFSETVYALIFIRRVDNGTENTSSKQSGIEFRSIYPIYVP